jgi:hypothetical protein
VLVSIRITLLMVQVLEHQMALRGLLPQKLVLLELQSHRTRMEQAQEYLIQNHQIL